MKIIRDFYLDRLIEAKGGGFVTGRFLDRINRIDRIRKVAEK